MATTTPKRLPGLDGLRAVAVSFVLFSHLKASEGWVDFAWTDQLQRVFSGHLGVQIFFTISGFIITLLLLREKQKSGTISLKNFWLRRALRILPPAGAFLLFLQLIAALRIAPIPAETQWGSLLFFRNMMPQDPWFTSAQGFTGHFWSLSVEEQFYLGWPLLVAFASMPTLRRVAWISVAASIGFRVLSNILLGNGSERWLPMNLDGFMVGALVAFEVAATSTGTWRSLWRYRWPALIAALIATRMAASSLGHYVDPVQPLIAAIAVGIWIAGLVTDPAGVEARLLNSKPFVKLGLYSYSIYLWQQLCMGPSGTWTAGKAPWLAVYPQNILTALLCGALSYWLIELPSMRIKDRLMGKLRSRATTPSGAAE